ncbi:MAG: hypothetical protein NTY12_03500 [Candidatus Falkowbacteria bacterium]|nr:hypothetical protein [Candidatus Falkowbacteria bacterium]
MIGFLLTILGSFLSETSTSIGKSEIKKKKESILSFMFLNLFFVFILFLGIAIVNPSSFVFSFKSLPTFTLRIVLELIQTYIAVKAIATADRTTFSFIRTITIPLLLLVDVILGYALNLNQIIGVAILFIALLLSFVDHTINKKGLGLVIFTAINSVATISLYKYNITHFNSFVAEQLIVTFFVIGAALIALIIKEKKNPFKLLLKKPFFFQSFFMGTAAIVESIAYTFLPASIVVAIVRASGMIWSTVSGRVYFKEKHILHKAAIVLIIIVGFVFLIK